MGFAASLAASLVAGELAKGKGRVSPTGPTPRPKDKARPVANPSSTRRDEDSAPVYPTYQPTPVYPTYEPPAPTTSDTPTGGGGSFDGGGSSGDW